MPIIGNFQLHDKQCDSKKRGLRCEYHIITDELCAQHEIQTDAICLDFVGFIK